MPQYKTLYSYHDPIELHDRTLFQNRSDFYFLINKQHIYISLVKSRIRRWQIVLAINELMSLGVTRLYNNMNVTTLNHHYSRGATTLKVKKKKNSHKTQNKNLSMTFIH